MTREEHLSFCKQCKNREMNAELGIVCGLTGKIADFEETCSNYDNDPNVKIVPRDEDGEVIETVEVSALSDELQDEFRSHQNLPYAIVGGVMLTILSALLWAGISLGTGYQHSLMAVGIGIIVGMGIRYFGAGVDRVFQYLGGALALFACLLGNYFTQIGFIADYEGIGYISTMFLLGLEVIPELLLDSFSPIDLLFYGIATYEGFRFAARPIPATIPDEFDTTPTADKLRFPLAIGGMVLIGVAGFFLNKEGKTEEAGYYENGQVMWEGDFEGADPIGEWKYFSETGSVILAGGYNLGREEGQWRYYDEYGTLTSEVGYINGLKDGADISYYADGSVADSVAYKKGRREGKAVSRYLNGSLLMEGEFIRDKREGTWNYYYPEGGILSTGEFKEDLQTGTWVYYDSDGKIQKKSIMNGDDQERILFATGPDGKIQVENGNGHYISYFSQGVIELEGDVVDSYPTGTWTTYDSVGNVKMKVEYKDQNARIMEVWDASNKQVVSNGYGEYVSYYPSGLIMEEGEIIEGTKNGMWTLYGENGLILSSIEYAMGIESGKIFTYSSDGTLLTEGQHLFGQRSGVWTWFYPNQNIDSTVEYKDGKKEGTQEFYSENGYLVMTEEYVKGELVDSQEVK